MLAQYHATLLNGHRSQHFCNGRHRNEWHLLPIMVFQPSFCQPLMVRERIRPHIYGIGSALGTIYTLLMQKDQVLFILTLKPSLHVNTDMSVCGYKPPSHNHQPCPFWSGKINVGDNFLIGKLSDLCAKKHTENIFVKIWTKSQNGFLILFQRVVNDNFEWWE
jgi:hypothetical protein